jgi:hypothetical protein
MAEVKPELTWSALLSDPAWATLAIGSEASLDAFAMHAVPSGVAARIIRGSRCTSRDELFHEFAAALQFPHYFGNNWSAFEDCVGDLTWLQAEKVVVFIARVDRLVAEEAPDFDVNVLLDVLHQAVRDPVTEWEEGQPVRGRFLHIVVHATDPIDRLLQRPDEEITVRTLPSE